MSKEFILVNITSTSMTILGAQHLLFCRLAKADVVTVFDPLQSVLCAEIAVMSSTIPQAIA